MSAGCLEGVGNLSGMCLEGPYGPGVGGVDGWGGLTMIIKLISVQVELHLDLPTGTELCNCIRKGYKLGLSCTF